MRILILGGDGYLGWPTAMYFSKRGQDVAVVDNFAKRRWELEMGIRPMIPIATLHERVKIWNSLNDKKIDLFIGDLCNHRFVYDTFNKFDPEVIIHYGEQPSAPFSMHNRENAVHTQVNNIVGTMNVIFAMKKHCPNAHLVKLGTMGEYGTPNIDIEEGYLEIEHNGRKDKFLYPKKPGSFYHLSKVHDSHNLEFATRNWDLRVTDLNQGPVYGVDTEESKMDERLVTSFHYDEVFGTVLNRFCVQAACGVPLTVYGKGGQTRGYLNILDTLQCVELAIENPADKGEMKIFNQFTEVFTINELAARVKEAGDKMGLDVSIQNVENPRKEQEEHYYNPKYQKFFDLGLKPHYLSDVLLGDMLQKTVKYKDNIDKDTILMNVKWEQR